ncbi:MAG: hypothetical protein ACR2IA_12030 [Pyrinomonadaceae bacterium]
MKAIPFVITGLINIGIGVGLFFFLLLGLNGYSGSQAEPGLIIFIVWVLLVSLFAAVLSVIATGYLMTKQSINFWISSLISVLIFVIVGAAINIVGWFVSLFVTEALR